MVLQVDSSFKEKIFYVKISFLMIIDLTNDWYLCILNLVKIVLTNILIEFGVFLLRKKYTS